ncbi:potassium-transporting ATPase subunit F [Streptomyces sp. ZL-24]|nr:K(+)-transporting ATPase subunit F [Streptomyces sp. ZL-24]POG47745.1 potassium-transporting ATPase subunit F [Streptomyces sp. ZL-24]
MVNNRLGPEVCLCRPTGRFPSSLLIPGARDGRSGLRRHHDRGIRAGGSRRPGGDQAVTAEHFVGLVVAVSLVGYLVLALLYPERF